MNHAPHFLVAKYVPDVRRIEPRNIGVILWSNRHVAARFIGENRSQGHSDVKTPSFVSKINKPVYLDWVHYWRVLLNESKIDTNDGTSVSVDSPHYLEAIKARSRGNFQLYSGGILFDQISSEDIQDAVDELFEQLVESHSPDPAARESEHLKRGWTRVLKKAGIKGHPKLSHQPITANFKGVQRQYKFKTRLSRTASQRPCYIR